MFQTTDAIFDGHTLLPDDPLRLEPNTRVRLIIQVLPVSNESTMADDEPPGNFQQAAQELIGELDQKYGTADRPPAKEPKSWLQIARDAKLEGPVDWSENLDKYLYGNPPTSTR
jgi:hypothetical protein